MLYRRENYPAEDELVLCTVTKVLNHAVFVNLDEYDKGGLIHISEVAPGRIRNIREFVELTKKIVCKVLRIDSERGHIDLSLRRVSEMEKKKKLEDIKQEQKAEKVIEIVSTQLELKVQGVYETVTAKVFERYPFVYQFFRDVADGKIKASELITDSKLASALQALVEERFKAAKVAIKGSFTLKSYEPNGVDIVRGALLAIAEQWKDILVISYLGGGRYKIKIESANYKDAESTLTQVIASANSYVTQNGECSFDREEE